MCDSGIWRLRLLGGCTLSGPDGAPVSLSTRKSLAMLVYLAGQPERRASRERLAALFWEDANPGQARLNLRKALSLLRQETRLEDRPDRVLLEADNDAAWLAPGVLTTDVETFEAALRSDPTDASTAARIAELYNGDFLSDFSVRGAPAFEDWVLLERQRLRELALTALNGLLDHALEPGFAPEVGVRAAMRVLALDPLQERAHRALMRLHVRQGRRAAALKQFHALSEQLARDLKTTPEAATRELFREISSSRHANASEGARTTAAVQDRTEPTAPIGAVTPRGGRARLVTTVAAACLALAAVSGGVAFFQPRLLPGLLAATAREKSVAVLPFANFSTEPDAGLFADGLTEEVINSLAQYADLKVSGRTSAFYFKGKNADLREVGRKLGVAYVVEGSVRREGDRLRVTAQLIDVADGFHIWSATYDRQMSDAFVIQDELARTVAEELKARLGTPRRQASHGTPEAYQLYLVARSHLRDTGDVKAARRLFERMLALEPDNPLALAGYADATISLAASFEIPFEDARKASEAAVDRALRIDPNSSEAYSAKSRIYSVLAGWRNESGYEERSLQAARRAVEISPRDPQALSHYGRQLIDMDREAEAVPVLERATDIDPLDRDAQAHLALAYRLNGDLDRAVRKARTVVELFPDYAYAQVVLGRTLYEQGRVVEAERAFRQAEVVAGGPKTLLDLVFFYANLQLSGEASPVLARLQGPPPELAMIRRTMELHLARDYRGAVELAESEVAKNPDSHMRGVLFLNAAIVGDVAKARRQLDAIAPELLAEKPVVTGSAMDAASIAANVLNRTGETAQARRILARILEMTTPRAGENLPANRWLARVSAYAELGEKDRALVELRRAIDAGFHDRIDFDNFIPLEDWPSLQPLRGDPRLTRMIGEIDARNRHLRDDLLASRRDK